MIVDYGKEETIKLIEEYYRKLEGREVIASIKASKECMGLFETEGCMTTITIMEKMNIAGVMKDVVTRITEDELRDCLGALFETYDFKVTSLTLNDGISSRWEGYGMMEKKVSSAYFKGITLNIEKLNNMNLRKR